MLTKMPKTTSKISTPEWRAYRGCGKYYKVGGANWQGAPVGFSGRVLVLAHGKNFKIQ